MISDFDQFIVGITSLRNKCSDRDLVVAELLIHCLAVATKITLHSIVRIIVFVL